MYGTHMASHIIMAPAGTNSDMDLARMEHLWVRYGSPDSNGPNSTTYTSHLKYLEATYGKARSYYSNIAMRMPNRKHIWTSYVKPYFEKRRDATCLRSLVYIWAKSGNHCQTDTRDATGQPDLGHIMSATWVLNPLRLSHQVVLPSAPSQLYMCDL